MKDTLRRVLDHLRYGIGQETLADAQLLSAFVTEGSEAAFAALLKRHGPMVLGVCRRVLRNVEDAEDAFQATFLVLVQKVRSLANRQALASWLYTVAFRTALQARAQNRRRGQREWAVPHRDAQFPASDDWQDILDEEINQLPEKYRGAVILCELQNRPRKLAAQQLGVPEGTLSSRLATARKMLQSRLSRRGVTLWIGAIAMSAMSQASAGVSPTLAAKTTKAAVLVAAGQLSGLLTPAAVLTRGVIKAMFVAKLKTTIASVLTVAALGAGSLLYCQTQTGTTGPLTSDNAQARATAPLKALQKPDVVEETAWGETVGGIQAGLAYPHGAKHAYGLDEQVTFVVRLRNVSSRKATVSFWSLPEDGADPILVAKDRIPRQAYPEIKSKDGKPAKVLLPPVWHYSPRVVERILEPGEVMELGRPTLWLVAANPSRKVKNTSLVAVPGNYRVHYPGLAGGMEFATGTGLLTTGIVDLEVKGAEESDPRPSDLSGNWQSVSFEQDGRQKFLKEDVRKVTASFRDCRYHMTPLPWGPEGSFVGTYQIDGDKEELKSFSLYPANGVLKGQAFRGIYRVEGDTLTLCFSWPPLDRPTEFRSRPNSTIVLAVFRRAKP